MKTGKKIEMISEHVFRTGKSPKKTIQIMPLKVSKHQKKKIWMIITSEIFKGNYDLLNKKLRTGRSFLFSKFLF
jgi:hypothetical protein